MSQSGLSWDYVSRAPEPLFIPIHKQDEKAPQMSQRFDEFLSLPKFLLKIRSHFRWTENCNNME